MTMLLPRLAALADDIDLLRFGFDAVPSSLKTRSPPRHLCLANKL